MKRLLYTTLFLLFIINESFAQFPLSVEVTITHPSSCISTNGSIAVRPHGGVSSNGTYLFDWNGLIPVGSFGMQTINNLIAGSYFITITDQGNNQIVEEIILECDSLKLEVIVTQPTDCTQKGAITAIPSGGVSPDRTYLFSWSFGLGATLDEVTVTNLNTGTYSVTVTDGEQAQIVEEITISCEPFVEPNISSWVKPTIAKIFPNPTPDKINIYLEKEYSNLQVELFNIQGVRLASYDYHQTQQFNVDLSNFTKGLYFLKVMSEEDIELISVVKQ